MVVQASELELAQQAILEKVKLGTSIPRDIIHSLKASGFDEDVIRGSIWLLLDQGLLDLDWKRQLVIPSQEHAA